MKKKILLAASSVLLALVHTGCSSNDSEPASAPAPQQ